MSDHMKTAGKVVSATKLKANAKAKTESYIIEVRNSNYASLYVKSRFPH